MKPHTPIIVLDFVLLVKVVEGKAKSSERSKMGGYDANWLGR